jgi:hypothetical protein
MIYGHKSTVAPKSLLDTPRSDLKVDTIPRWTHVEVKQAMDEGWRINAKNHVNWSKPMMRIESCNILTFACDWQAVYHVLQHASTSKLHRDALRIVYQI